MKMDKLIINQLNSLVDVPHSIEYDNEGNPISIKFYKNTLEFDKVYRIIFQEYFVKGFDGFDFNEKWNNGVYPPDIVMYGSIIEETENMYKLKLSDNNDRNQWTGWCPKKCCKVENL